LLANDGATLTVSTPLRPATLMLSMAVKGLRTRRECRAGRSAGLGQHELAIDALEQRDAQMVLQHLHLVADRAGVTPSSPAARVKLRCRAAAS
jgi:hypothetical protein